MAASGGIIRHRDCGTGHIPFYIGAALVDVDDVLALEQIAEW